MKTIQQYIEDMKSMRSGIVFWEPYHMETVFKAALEARHRETWAMALKEAANEGNIDDAHAILALPCPSIKNTCNQTNPARKGEVK